MKNSKKKKRKQINETVDEVVSRLIPHIYYVFQEKCSRCEKTLETIPNMEVSKESLATLCSSIAICVEIIKESLQELLCDD